MKRYLLTFTDSRMEPSARRIRKQAQYLGVYDEIITANENSLERDFLMDMQHIMTPGSKGYGYWSWKPKIIQQTLLQIDDGDLLQYTDAGCHLNLSGKNRLMDYFSYANKSKTGILAFQGGAPKAPLIYDGRRLLDLTEKKWCKGDLFDYFGVRDRADVTDTQQIGATVIFIRKCKKSVEIIDSWISTFRKNLRMIDDSSSQSPNFEGFIEHRYDQAIFSIICKMNNVDVVSASEYWYPSNTDLMKPDWTPLKNYPIHKLGDKKLSYYYQVENWVSRAKKKAKYLFND